MRKYCLTIILCLTALFLSGCSSTVSLSEYNKVVSERDAAIKERDDLLCEKNDLESEYKKSADKVLELTQEQLKLSYPTAWAQTAFGDNAVVMSGNDEYLDIVVPTEDELNKKNVSQYIKKFIASSATLKYLVTSYPDSFPYNRISVSYLDENGNGVITSEYMRNDDDYTSGSTLISMSGVDSIYSGIKDALNK